MRPESHSSTSSSRLQLRSFLLIYCLLLVVVGISLATSSSTVDNLQTIEQTQASISDGSTRDADAPDLLLSVPFYVYEEFAWINATYMNRPIHDVASNSSRFQTRFKHGDDYWFLQASLKHPMRTHNMSEAKLFYVPFLLNFLDQIMYYKQPLCVKDLCDFDLLLDSQQRLRESPAFQEYPDRHMIVRSSYNAAGDKWNKKLGETYEGYNKFMELFVKMNVVVFEDKDKFPNPGYRHAFTSYYVGSPCQLVTGNKPYDVAMIASFKKGQPSFKDRKNMCKWLSSNESSVKTSVCGEGARCPALAESKFGFHAPGDTWGSQRVMDTILSGTVPIFTHLNQYHILGHWIDWSQLSFYLPVHNDSITNRLVVTKYSMEAYATQEIFLERLRTILDDKEGYERKHKAVLEHIPLFDYTTLYPFDTYMYLLQAELYPETRHRRSRWSAMLLPRPLFVDPQ